MESFPRLTRILAAGRSRPPDLLHSNASHNKVNEFCATHNSVAFARNRGGLRNGCLIFWKLVPPNLIPGLVRLPIGSKKAVYEQHLSQNSGLTGVPDRLHGRP